MSKNKYAGMTVTQIAFDIQKKVIAAGQGEAFKKAIMEDDRETIKSILTAIGVDGTQMQIGTMEGPVILREDLIKKTKKKTGIHEYRSDLANYRRWLMGSLVSVPIVLFIGTQAISWRYVHNISLGGILIGIIVAVLVGVFMYFLMSFLISQSRVTTTDTQIIYRGLLGRKYIVDLTKPIIGILTYYQQDTPISTSPSFGMLIIKNTSSRKHSEIRLLDAYYDFETLVEVAKVAGIEFATDTYSHTPREIEKIQPGLMRFSELHPMIFVSIVIPVSLVVLAAIVYPLTVIFNP